MGLEFAADGGLDTAFCTHKRIHQKRGLWAAFLMVTSDSRFTSSELCRFVLLASADAQFDGALSVIILGSWSFSESTKSRWGACDLILDFL